MKRLIKIPDLIPNCAEIVELAIRYQNRFVSYPQKQNCIEDQEKHPFNPYRPTEYEEDDRYHVLQFYQMPRPLKLAINSIFSFYGKDYHLFYTQIQRYDLGDFVLPHRDELLQGLYNLTTSTSDGLVVQDGDQGFVKHIDTSGTFLLHDNNAWHWVDPVINPPRFTMITIPPLFTFDELEKI